MVGETFLPTTCTPFSRPQASIQQLWIHIPPSAGPKLKFSNFVPPSAGPKLKFSNSAPPQAGPKLLALSNKGSDKGRGERRRDGENGTKKRAKRRESVEVERVSKESGAKQKAGRIGEGGL